MIIFPDIVTSDFIYKYLPRLIYDMILVVVNKNKFDELDAYFKSIGIDYSTMEILKLAINNLEVKEVNGTYQIEISNILKIKQYTLNQLVKLIDYGNMEVKGVGIIKEIEDYINSRKGIIIEDYMNG